MILKTSADTVQSLGKKEGKHNWGVLVKHCSRRAQLSWQYMHPTLFVRPRLFILSESQKSCLLGAPLQEGAAVKEFRIMLIVSSQRHGQVSLFIIQIWSIFNVSLLYFGCLYGPSLFLHYQVFISDDKEIIFMIRKALTFCYSSNMSLYTTSSACIFF